MKFFLRCLVALLMFAGPMAQAADGLVVAKSPFDVAETMNRVEATAKQRGFNIVARIDHAAGAAAVGRTLRPTQVLIFGNPKGGTPFMECAQTIGIDLPIKVLVWQDGHGQVLLGYNDPAYIARRHGVPECPAASGMASAMAELIAAAVAP